MGKFFVNSLVGVAIVFVFHTATSNPVPQKTTRAFDDYSGVGLTGKGVKKIKDENIGESVGKKIGSKKNDVIKGQKTQKVQKVLGSPMIAKHETTEVKKPSQTFSSPDRPMSKRAKKWWHLSESQKNGGHGGSKEVGYRHDEGDRIKLEELGKRGNEVAA